MREEWWESPVCYICDYWWALLLGLILAATAYFTRPFWLPALGFSPEVSETPTVTVLPTTQIPTATLPPYTITPSVSAAVTPTVTPGTFSGYTNTLGSYAFNYPTVWEGTELGADAQFETPEGGVVYIHVEPRPQGETSAEFSEASMAGLPYDVLERVESTIAGYPAFCTRTANAGEDQVIALTCYFVVDAQGYVLSLAYLDQLTPEEIQLVQMQFMDFAASFIVLP